MEMIQSSNSNIEKLKRLNAAADLALKLNRWWTPEKTADEAFDFLHSQTNDEDLIEKATIIWASAVWDIAEETK